MNKKFFADIKNIRTAIDTNKLVVIAGAGISVDAGVPNWNSLINHLRSEIEVPINEHDSLKIAQMYFNDRQQKEFIDKVRTVLNHKKVKYNEIHEELLQLNPEHILTTNFDDLLEQVIKKRSLPFSIVTKDKEFPYALNTKLLVKIHGDLDNTDIVLTEDDFLNYSLNHPLIEAFIKSVFASKIILFIGYSFSDIDLKMTIQTVRSILGGHFQNAYLLTVDEMHDAQREYLKHKGVNVVSYFDVIDDERRNYIDEYLNGKNALNEVYFKQGENLSKQGQNLLNFLRFISVYDKFNEPLVDSHLIDQIHLSLGRFSEFNSLPPDFVANLFPFNVSKEYVHNYHYFSMLTGNKNLFELFYSQVNTVKGNLKYSPPENLGSESLENYEKKLQEIIIKLNSSLIFKLQTYADRPDSLGNKGWSDRYKDISGIANEAQTALIDRYYELDFAGIVSEALNQKIEETTNIQTDLDLAFIHYKIGDFRGSYNLFEEIANKAWQTGKYFTYYIAKKNAKTLRNLVDLFATELKDNHKKILIRNIDDIDLDKLLFQVPYMGELEYRLLKSIRNDDILIKAKLEIDEVFDKILDLHHRYKQKTFIFSGPYYYKVIYLELHKMISFYSYNGVVSDAFRDFQSICQKGINALLICFAIHNDYNERLKEFNELFFVVLVNYCNAHDVKETIEKYQIEEFVFEEKAVNRIIRSANNFLKSFISESTVKFFGPLENISVSNQVNTYFFGEECRRIFKNLFLILSKYRITFEQGNAIIENLINFLEYESFLFHSDVEFLFDFIEFNFQLFSAQDFIKILDIASSSKSKWRNYYGEALLNSIAKAFKKNAYEGISDRLLIFRIFHLSKENDWLHQPFVQLWLISNEEIRQELKEEIDDILNDAMTFDINLYKAACLNKIIEYDLYFEDYLSEINRHKGNGSYSLNAGKPILQSSEFINAMYLIYELEISCGDERLKVFTNLAEYMKFYLFPEQYNYDNFKAEWLLMVRSNLFFDRFKRIASLKKSIEKELQNNFNNDLGLLYAKYFV